MRRVIGICLVMLAAPAYSQPVLFPDPLSERIANYRIDARLDVKTRQIKGSEQVSWRNTSPDPVEELQFHLYLNAFQNDRSSFAQEYMRGLGSPIGIDPRDMPQDGWGFIRLDKVALESGIDLSGSLEFISPDDGNPEDQTVVRIWLPEPVPPGEFVSLRIDFTSRLPEPPVKRSGMKGEYFFAGQWFPKIGVYFQGKWNCHQYHANSEFFADFGVYDVKMTVPAGYVIGATGLPVEVKDNADGTRTHWYHAEDVHDFAWTGSPEFVEFTDRVQDVDIRLLMQPEHVGQSERHLMAARAVIERLQDWYGNYPYPNLTIVDPRHGATYTGGMEYPTLITAWTAYGLPAGVRIPELVIIHEFIHNYFYHLVATNEFEESWLDEGITSYVEVQVMRKLFGPAANLIDFLGFEIDDMQYKRWMCHRYANPDAMLLPVWNYHSATSYRVNSYLRPALLLETLKNLLGPDVMRGILRRYVESFRFKHPQTDDFVAVASDVAGQDLAWLFDQALYSNARLDYAVDYVDTRPGAEPGVVESEVGVRRAGEFQFPMELEIVFEDGQKVREVFDGTAAWQKYRYTKPARLVSAELDPDEKVPLEASRGNNSRTVKSHRAGTLKTGAAALFWGQVLMDLP